MSSRYLLVMAGSLVAFALPLLGQQNSKTGANPLRASSGTKPVASAPAPAPAPAHVPAPPVHTIAVPVTIRSSGSQPAALETSAIVLGYHQFTPAGIGSKNIYSMSADAFESEMKYLQDSGCHVVPLSNIVRFVEHKGGLPPHAVAITIDDGYASPILYAAPILKKYGYPWTFFCYTDYINSGSHAASWKDLQELQAEGVDIECHSKSHPFLSRKLGKSPEDYDKWLTAETAGAKAILEQHLNKKIQYFAYPYGDYNKQVEDKLIASGYEAIFTVADNPIHATTSPYRMGRYVITSPEEKDFASYLSEGAPSLMAASPAPGATVADPKPVISAVLSYAGHLDPKSIEASVKGFGPVPATFDDKTSTVRLYLQRNLIQPVVSVTIRFKDPQANQTFVTNWQFNYEAVEPGAKPAAVISPRVVANPVTPVKAK